MDRTDAALLRAWELSGGELGEGPADELEELLPTLVAAGYAEEETNLWRFTPTGLARFEELTAE